MATTLQMELIWALGASNVRSLYGSLAVNALLPQKAKYKLNIAKVEETKLLVSKIMDGKSDTVFKKNFRELSGSSG